MRVQRPCFWYLGCGVVLAPLAFFSWFRVPDMMEQFRPANGGLLDVMMLSLKLSASVPAIALAGSLGLFAASAFSAEIRSPLAVKTASLFLIAFLMFGCLQVYMALFVVAYCGVWPRH
jgi:hypothetical protein